MRLIPDLRWPLRMPSRRGGGPIAVSFVIDRLSRAGTETQLVALINGLDRQQFRPSLCLLNGADSESRSLEPHDCPILDLGLRGLFRAGTVRGLARLASFWRKQQVDIVQTYFLDSSYLAIPLARACGVPHVLRVRNNSGYWLTRKHRILSRFVGRLTHCTLTNSQDAREALLAVEGLDASRIRVIENGVDLDRFVVGKPPATGGTQVRIGVVANLRPVKNIEGLIRAAELLRDRPNLIFEVAGEGELRPRLEEQIRGAGLADRFILSGATRDVPGFLARQDIAILCSHSESLSNALLEYMAAGRAIVATDVGAASRLIQDGQQGLIVAPGDDQALAAAIRRYLDDPSLAVRAGQAARSRVERDYSRPAMISRFQDFYQTLSRRAGS